MRKVSMHFTVVTSLIFLSTFIIAIMFFFQIKFVEKLATKAASEDFTILSKNLKNNLQKLDFINSSYVDIFSSFLLYHAREDFFKNQEVLLKQYISVLKNNEDMHALSVASEDDYFFQISKIHASSKILNKYKIKKDDRWLIVKMDGKSNVQHIKILDKNLHVSSSKKIYSHYKPSTKSWFKRTLDAHGSILKTDPFRFVNDGLIGITYSKEFKKGIVFTIDILIEDIHKMIDHLKFSTNIEVVILGKQFNFITKKDQKKFQKIVNKIKHEQQLLHLKKFPINGIIESNNTKFIYRINSLTDNKLILISDFSLFKKPYEDDFQILIISAIIIFLILLPVILYFTSVIVKPIKLLAKENKKIETLDFKNIKKIDSPIREISYLSSSFLSMAKAIEYNKSFLEEEVKERTKKLKILSTTDALTGLYNRMRIDNSLKYELNRQDRYGHEFGIIFIDIDHFKSINDTYGHQAGDKVLIKLAKILKKNARKSDIVGRWGGEEFIIICLETNKKNIISIAENLRSTIENSKFIKTLQITASFGVTLYKEKDTKKTIIKRADLALYKAKENGRNRVETNF